jgi:uncharacterized protein (TIGR02996 family)
MTLTYADAFLQAICDEPDEDTHRLVFADWLEEQGDEESLTRAEFIRAQIELAGPDLDGERRDFLAARVRELERRQGRAWAGPVARLVRNYAFRRGFVESVECRPEGFLKNADRLLRHAPIRHATLSLRRGHGARLAACPALARIPSLELHCTGNDPSGLARLLDSPHLAGLRTLKLRCPTGSVAAVAGSSRLANLIDLDLGGRSFDPDSLGQLLQADLPALRKLYLLSSGLRAADARLLANSPLLAQLTDLGLTYNAVDAVGAAFLARSPGVRGLHALALGSNGIRDLGARVLAESENLAGLTRLYLGNNRIGPEGVQALASSPHLAGLTTLDLDYNDLTPAALQALARSPHLRHLHTLFVRTSRKIAEKTKNLLVKRFGAATCRF